MAQQAEISNNNTHRALNNHSQLYLEKINAVHHLHNTHFPIRVEYCQWLLSLIHEKGSEIHDATFFTDEARFHLSGHIIDKKCLVWSVNNSHKILEQPLNDKQIGVWCAT